MFGHELRAAAAPRLRPANRCAIDFHRSMPSARRQAFSPQLATQSIHSIGAIGQSETTSHRFPVRVQIFSSVMRPFSHAMSIV